MLLCGEAYFHGKECNDLCKGQKKRPFDPVCGIVPSISRSRWRILASLKQNNLNRHNQIQNEDARYEIPFGNDAEKYPTQ
jgi:hypothetical protein